MKRRSIALGLPLLALCSASAVRAGDWLPAPVLPDVLLRDQRVDLPVGPPARWILLTGSVDNVKKTLAPFDAATQRPADHPALLWLGHESRGRWTRTSALNPPHMLIRRLEELIS